MNLDIEGVDMGDKDAYKIDQLFIVMEDGTKMPLKDVELISNDNLSEEVSISSGIRGTFYGMPVKIECDVCFINQKVLYKLVYGISNNYLRMHGKPALREHTRYKWYKKYKRKE